MSQRHPLQNGIPMLVTITTKGRKPVFSDPAMAREAVEAIYRTQTVHPFLLFGFVVMPDHCHLLINVPEPETVSNVIKSYKSSVSFSAGKGSLWQPRFHISIPNNSWKVSEYINLNPIKSGLCDNPNEYPWSSASGKWDVTDLPYFVS